MAIIIIWWCKNRSPTFITPTHMFHKLKCSKNNFTRNSITSLWRRGGVCKWLNIHWLLLCRIHILLKQNKICENKIQEIISHNANVCKVQRDMRQLCFLIDVCPQNPTPDISSQFKTLDFSCECCGICITWKTDYNISKHSQIDDW